MSLAMCSIAARAFVDCGDDPREPAKRTLFGGGNDLCQTGLGPDARLYAERWTLRDSTSSLSTSTASGAIRLGNTSLGSMRPPYEVVDWLRAGAARMRAETEPATLRMRELIGRPRPTRLPDP